MDRLQTRFAEPPVAVVGGGIVGSSAAYWLSRQGRPVVLIDNADAGYATAAGAGIVSPGTSVTATDEVELLSFTAAAFYPELIAALADDGVWDVGYEQPGTLFVAIGEQERERLPDVLKLIEGRRQQAGESIGAVSRLSATEAARLFPVLGPEIEAIHLSGGCRVDGRRLRAALRSALELRGETIISGRATLSESGSDGEWALEVEGRPLPASKIILATGAWRYAWARLGAVELPIAPQRGQIMHLELPATDTSAWPTIVGFGSHYMLAFGPNRVVSGATRETGVGFDHRVTVEGQAELLRETMRLAPGLSSATVVETRVGFRPRSEDDRPIVGAMPGSSNTIVATGLGALGITLGPYVGAQAAELAGGAAPAPVLAPFSAARFAAR